MKQKVDEQAWTYRMFANNLTSDINHKFVERLQAELDRRYQEQEAVIIRGFSVTRGKDGKVLLDCGATYKSVHNYEWLLENGKAEDLWIDGSLDLVWTETIQVCIAKYKINHYAKIPEEDKDTLRMLGKITSHFTEARVDYRLNCSI